MTVTLTDNDLRHRLHRAARMVVMQVDRAEAHPDSVDDMGRAAIAMGLWEVFTGIDDTARAVVYARRVANPAWLTEAVS